jgi:hypothetical protein
MDELNDSQWDSYRRDGYLRSGRVLDPDDLQALQRRIDDIMLHRATVDYGQLMMQLDGTSEQTLGSKGATLAYRKIQNLEHDQVFLDYLTRPLFRSICQRVYGTVPITCYRAMFMNKPANQGTFLSWHQDRWQQLDRDRRGPCGLRLTRRPSQRMPTGHPGQPPTRSHQPSARTCLPR